MALIAFGVLVCALGEANLVMKGLVQQLVALGFEVRCGASAGRQRTAAPQACVGPRHAPSASRFLARHAWIEGQRWFVYKAAPSS